MKMEHEFKYVTPDEPYFEPDLDLERAHKDYLLKAREDLLKAREDLLTGDADFDECLAKCIEVLKVKGADYTIGNADRLWNFKDVARQTGLTPYQTLGVYFHKHVSAVFAFIKANGQQESEPIEGRIADVINYMLLFYKMVQEQKR